MSYTIGVPLGPHVLYHRGISYTLGPHVLYIGVPLGPHVLYHRGTFRSSCPIP